MLLTGWDLIWMRGDLFKEANWMRADYKTFRSSCLKSNSEEVNQSTEGILDPVLQTAWNLYHESWKDENYIYICHKAFEKEKIKIRNWRLNEENWLFHEHPPLSDGILICLNTDVARLFINFKVPRKLMNELRIQKLLASLQIDSQDILMDFPAFSATNDHQSKADWRTLMRLKGISQRNNKISAASLHRESIKLPA